MKNTNCINCGAPFEPEIVKCKHCGTAVLINWKNPFNVLKVRKFRLKAIYPILILLGFGGLIYIYGIAFDSFSETTLIQITPMWFIPIIFGLYGYLAEFLMDKVIKGKGENISDAYKKWTKSFILKHIFSGLILLIIMIPFNFLKLKNSFLVAFIGSVIWGIFLIIFFNAIFPAL